MFDLTEAVQRAGIGTALLFVFVLGIVVDRLYIIFMGEDR